MKKFLSIAFMFLALALTATEGYSSIHEPQTARAVVLAVPDLAQCEPSGYVQPACETVCVPAVEPTFLYSYAAFSFVNGFVPPRYSASYRHFQYSRRCTGLVPDGFSHRWKHPPFSRHVYPANS